MRKWSYNSTSGGIENNLSLLTSEPLPKPTPSEHLVQIIAVGLNPVDYKPAEAPLVGRFAVPKPATPGFDISGRIVVPAADSALKPGQLVYGAASTNALVGGGLAEYVAIPTTLVSKLPTGLSPVEAASFPVAAITAHGSLIPYIRAGTRVFLNGGSGGVGTFGIQIAKAASAHVTVSCSARNAELCRSLGADEVLDYTARPLLDQLRDDVKASGKLYEHVVDNVFSDPELYYRAHEYTTTEARFVEVATAPSLAFLRFAAGAFLTPGFLGGGRRKLVMAVADVNEGSLEMIGKLIAEGRVKPVVERVSPMEEVAEAYRLVKTGRTRGKVVIDVAGETQ